MTKLNEILNGKKSLKCVLDQPKMEVPQSGKLDCDWFFGRKFVYGLQRCRFTGTHLQNRTVNVLFSRKREHNWITITCVSSGHLLRKCMVIEVWDKKLLQKRSSFSSAESEDGNPNVFKVLNGKFFNVYRTLIS